MSASYLLSLGASPNGDPALSWGSSCVINLTMFILCTFLTNFFFGRSVSNYLIINKPEAHQLRQKSSLHHPGDIAIRRVDLLHNKHECKCIIGDLFSDRGHYLRYILPFKWQTNRRTRHFNFRWNFNSFIILKVTRNSRNWHSIDIQGIDVVMLSWGISLWYP